MSAGGPVSLPAKGVLRKALSMNPASAYAAYGTRKDDLPARTGVMDFTKARPREIVLDKLRPDTR